MVKMELVEKIVRMPNLDYEPEESIGKVFYDQMRKHGDKIAQYIAETGEVDPFSALLQRSIRVALKMRDQGLTKGDIISICSHDHINNNVAFIASLFLGLTVASSLDPKVSVPYSIILVKKVTPKLIFASSDAVQFVEQCVQSANVQSKIVVFGEHDTYESFEDYLVPHEDETDFKPVSLPVKETTIILFSSGSTGVPKGVCHSSYSILCNVINCLPPKSPENTECPVVGCALLMNPLYWVTGVISLGYSIIEAVPRLICKPSCGPLDLWEYIDEYKVFYVLFTPFKANAMLKVGKPVDRRFSNLNSMSIGGENMSERDLMALRKLLPNTSINMGFGQSEVGCITKFSHNYRDKELSDKKPKSCGLPMKGISYKIVDTKTEEILGPNQPGELRIKTPFLMNGYYQQDSSSAFDSEGWFKTGDLLCYDEDLCFYVVDRLNDVLKYQGQDISPSHLENVIESYPGVRKAVVIGIPNEIDGDWPMAIIQLEEHTNITVQQIEEFVNVQVPEFQKLRAGIRFLKEFPRTPTDKVSRGVVRELVLSGKI